MQVMSDKNTEAFTADTADPDYASAAYPDILRVGQAESDLIEVGKSAYLKAIFENISTAEGWTADGQSVQKFHKNTTYELATLIACRVYGKVSREFIYACLAAEALSNRRDGYVGLFMTVAPAYGRSFRALGQKKYASDSLGPDRFGPDSFGNELGAGKPSAGSYITLEQSGFQVHTDMEPFTVHFDRLPLMSALFEFLVEAIGFAEVDTLLKPVLAQPILSAEIDAAANSLSKEIYNFLDDHLPSQQTQLRFRNIIDFFASRAPDGSVAKPDDESILAFWEEASVQDDMDFRTFRGAVSAVIEFWRSMDQAQSLRAMTNAAPIGTDWDAFEQDVSADDVADGAAEDAFSPLAVLDDSPAVDVKVFNKSERALIDPLFACSPVHQELPLTVLRWHLFGAAQARLTQALRRKMSLEQMDAFLDHKAVTEDYAVIINAFAKVAEHCANACHAAVPILLKGERVLGLVIAQELEPSLVFQNLEKFLQTDPIRTSENVVRFPGSGPVQCRVSSVMADTSPEADALFKKCQKAFKDLNRKGFQSMTADAETLDGLEYALPAVQFVEKELKTFLKSVNTQIDTDAVFAADHERFMAVFRQLYGDKT